MERVPTAANVRTLDATAGDAASPPAASQARRLLWLRRLGFAGFLFFLAKGLLWLTLPLLLAYGCVQW